jgi:hypothetical protein
MPKTNGASVLISSISNQRMDCARVKRSSERSSPWVVQIVRAQDLFSRTHLFLDMYYYFLTHLIPLLSYTFAHLLWALLSSGLRTRSPRLDSQVLYPTRAP